MHELMTGEQLVVASAQAEDGDCFPSAVGELSATETKQLLGLECKFRLQSEL